MLNSTCQEAALSFAVDRGWDVFPAPPGEKKSYKSAKHSGGRNWGRTKDPEEIKYDWARWPKANIGIPTGIENGIFVVEADTVEAHNVDGIAALNALEAQYSELPDTLTAASPSGSLHFYFKHPGGDVRIKNSASEIATGVDVRGDGGMVIAPPSVRGDGVYYWITDLPIADPPPWLLALVTQKVNGKGEGEHNVDATPGEAQADPQRIALALETIPNEDVGWEQWNRVGMATFVATGRSEEGFEAFSSWSAKSRKHDPQTTREKWDQYFKSPPTSIGAGTIFFMAAEAGDEATAIMLERQRADYLERHAKVDAAEGEPSAAPPTNPEPRTNPPPRVDTPPSPSRPAVFWHGESVAAPIPWLVKGLIKQTGAMLLSGQWGAGKTFVALDLAGAIATKQEKWIDFPIKRHGGVVFIAAESPGSLPLRVNVMMEEKYQTKKTPFVWIAGYKPNLLRRGQHSLLMKDLIELMKQAQEKMQEKFGVDLVLIIIDTVAASSGFTNENAADARATASWPMSSAAGIRPSIPARLPKNMRNCANSIVVAAWWATTIPPNGSCPHSANAASAIGAAI
jgi:hypothetical protein